MYPAPLENPNLDDDQKRAICRATDGDAPDAFLFWWKMGTGKTRLALWLFEYSGFDDLIVITRRVAFDDWIIEMEKNGLDYNVYQDGYAPTDLTRLAHAKKPKRVILISHAMLEKMPPKWPKGQMIAVDELYLFSNPKARRSLALHKIILFCSARIGLSGTIMPAEDNMTIYGQAMALGIHRVLASGTTEFATKFQVRAKGRFAVKFINKPGADKKISALLAPYVDIHMPEDKPSRTQILAVTKTPAQATAIRQLESVYEFNNREYEYALQILNVVNGISNGWWVDSDGAVEHLASTKVDRCIALVDDLVSAGERVVVWCAYHNDIARLKAALKHDCAIFTAKDRFDLEGWKRGDYPVVLATEAYGASVNHFGQVKYAIYFSINYKLLDLQQSMKRHERKDSQHGGAHYYFLQTKGTNDARAYYLVTKSGKSEKDLVSTLKENLFKWA